MKFAWSLGMVEDASKRVDDPALLWKILRQYAASVVGPDHQVGSGHPVRRDVLEVEALEPGAAVVVPVGVVAMEDEVACELDLVGRVVRVIPGLGRVAKSDLEATLDLFRGLVGTPSPQSGPQPNQWLNLARELRRVMQKA